MEGAALGASDGVVRVGVVGLGYWGPNLARNFGGIPGCEVRWLCDASAGGSLEAGSDTA